MSNSSLPSDSVVWRGRPWIVPAAVGRASAVLVVTVVVVWLEFLVGTASSAFLGVPLYLWTVFLFFVVWLISLGGLVVLRATNLYTLRTDTLEIMSGILTSREVTIVASGFSDLEVVRGVVGRMFGYGDIVIRMQSERASVKVMVKVRDALKVGEQIRYVMGRPVVRLESQLPPGLAPKT